MHEDSTKVVVASRTPSTNEVSIHSMAARFVDPASDSLGVWQIMYVHLASSQASSQAVLETSPQTEL